jgi:hypothetical protein
MAILARRAAGHPAESAFENIISCPCGHGIGSHNYKGCVRCACVRSSGNIVDQAIEYDRVNRALMCRTSLSAFFSDRRP